MREGGDGRAPRAAPQEECPRGDQCACAIGTRHFWFTSFCNERESLHQLREALRTLEQEMREAMTEHARYDYAAQSWSLWIGQWADTLAALAAPESQEG